MTIERPPLYQVGDAFDSKWGETISPVVMAPSELPDKAPAEFPAPWKCHNRGNGEWDVFADFRKKARKDIDTRVWHGYVGKVYCADWEDVSAMNAKIASVNSSENAEVRDPRPLPLRFERYGQPGGIDIWDLEGFIVEGYSGYVPEYEDLDTYIALTERWKHHNNEVVFGDLKNKLAEISAIDDELERNQAIQHEYDRLALALEFDFDVVDKLRYERISKNRKSFWRYMPLFFSRDTRMAISQLFQEAGRTDLAANINGIAKGKALWAESQQAEDDLGRLNPVLKIHGLIEDEWFSIEDLQINTDDYHSILPVAMKAWAESFLMRMRGVNTFEKAETHDFSSGRRCGFEWLLEPMIETMSLANCTPSDIGMTEAEIETTRNFAYAHDSYVSEHGTSSALSDTLLSQIPGFDKFFGNIVRS